MNPSKNTVHHICGMQSSDFKLTYILTQELTQTSEKVSQGPLKTQSPEFLNIGPCNVNFRKSLSSIFCNQSGLVCRVTFIHL